MNGVGSKREILPPILWGFNPPRTVRLDRQTASLASKSGFEQMFVQSATSLSSTTCRRRQPPRTG